MVMQSARQDARPFAQRTRHVQLGDDSPTNEIAFVRQLVEHTRQLLLDLEGHEHSFPAPTPRCLFPGLPGHRLRGSYFMG
jgi:hypothetical protein